MSTLLAVTRKVLLTIKYGNLPVFNLYATALMDDSAVQ